MKILLAGVSVRALAQSAVRAGRHAAALDYFGDRDLSGLVESRSLSRMTGASYDASALPALARGMRYDALAYAANLENHPDVVAALAGNRPIIGNDPDTLRRVRHWPTLRAVCAEKGIAMPATLFPGEEGGAPKKVRWLRKPVKSGGGHGIRAWDGAALDGSAYLQAFAPGVSASAVFAANGRECAVLGLGEQLIGHDGLEGLGAHGFRHCGNIMPLAPALGGGPELLAAVRDMLGRLTRRFGLRGVCGADFIVGRGRDGAPVPLLLEINPRPSSSAELAERAGAITIFEAHAASSMGETPQGPDDRTILDPLGGGFLAKGIAFARWESLIPETMPATGATLLDVGEPGDRVRPGAPVCSLIVRARGRDAALGGLLDAAGKLGHAIRADESESTPIAPTIPLRGQGRKTT